MSDEPDIEPETAKKIFTENVHKIPPQHLTENGFRYVVCVRMEDIHVYLSLYIYIMYLCIIIVLTYLVTIVVVECMCTVPFVIVKVEETTRETTLTNKCTHTCLLLMKLDQVHVVCRLSIDKQV